MKYSNTAKPAILIALSLAISSCANNLSSDRLARADFGSDITQEQCSIVAEEAIAKAMRFPESANFRNGSCEKGYWNSLPLYQMRRVYGWVQSGEVNGSNVYGGTGGFRPYKVIIRDGAMVRYCIREKAGGFCVPFEGYNEDIGRLLLVDVED